MLLSPGLVGFSKPAQRFDTSCFLLSLYFVDIKRQKTAKDVRCPRCREVGQMRVGSPLVRCKECGEQSHMQKDCEAVLCYFCKKVGHRKAGCPMVKRRFNFQRLHLVLVVVIHLLE